MSMEWIAKQLEAAADAASVAEPPQNLIRFNPKPPGSIQPGSATEAVMAFLNRHPGIFFTHAQILRATGRTTKAVAWALIFLREMGVIEVAPDLSRNSRFLRYRLAKTAAKERGH